MEREPLTVEGMRPACTWYIPIAHRGIHSWISHHLASAGLNGANPAGWG